MNSNAMTMEPAAPRANRTTTQAESAPRPLNSRSPAAPTTRRSGVSLSADLDPAYRLYLRDIGSVQLLTPEQEVELSERVQNGDDEARELMIRANLRLVVKIARDYMNYGLSLLDLINEGNIGLMKAVERFDPNKGGKLSTYSAWWIKQSIKRALANQSKTIRLPVHMVDKISRMRRATAQLRETLGREPNMEEIAEKLEVSVQRVQEMTDASATPASLNAALGGEENTGELEEIIPDESAGTPYLDLEAANTRGVIQELLASIPPRDAKVLEYRFGLHDGRARTLEEVGEIVGITRERVRQIQNQSLGKLRRALERMESFGA